MTSPTPFHVAIIPDGNRRWAKQNGIQGYAQLYKKGTERVVEVIQTGFENGASHVSFWASSYANIHDRSSDFFETIDRLYRENIQKFADHDMIEKYDMKINIIGEWRQSLTPETVAILEKAIEQTKHRKGRVLSLLISYSGKRERAAATKKLLETSDSDSVDSSETADHLLRAASWTRDLPELDLLVRTGAWQDPHNSAGFMNLLSDETQFAFPEVLWPDFSGQMLGVIVENYKQRERRHGA